MIEVSLACKFVFDGAITLYHIIYQAAGNKMWNTNFAASLEKKIESIVIYYTISTLSTILM